MNTDLRPNLSIDVGPSMVIRIQSLVNVDHSHCSKGTQWQLQSKRKDNVCLQGGIHVKWEHDNQRQEEDGKADDHVEGGVEVPET